MHKLNDVEAERDALIKEVRREIRLEFSLIADGELHHLRGGSGLTREILASRKAQRSEVRAKYSDEATRKIGEILPRLLQQFDDYVMAGELYTYKDGHLVFKRYLRILDFDCECRPMAFYGEWVTKEITAIAWKTIGQKSTHCWLLEPTETWEEHQAKKREGLLQFLSAYERADIVTGHYIRGFDLPLINAHCVDLGVHPLGPKLAHDTKGDLISMHGISKSQQNMAAHLDDSVKEGMDTAKWELANTLVREGRAETKRRVVGDVVQHIQFRDSLLKRHALKPPTVWTSGAKLEEYLA